MIVDTQMASNNIHYSDIGKEHWQKFLCVCVVCFILSQVKCCYCMALLLCCTRIVYLFAGAHGGEEQLGVVQVSHCVMAVCYCCYWLAYDVANFIVMCFIFCVRCSSYILMNKGALTLS